MMGSKFTGPTAFITTALSLPIWTLSKVLMGKTKGPVFPLLQGPQAKEQHFENLVTPMEIYSGIALHEAPHTKKSRSFSLFTIKTPINAAGRDVNRDPSSGIHSVFLPVTSHFQNRQWALQNTHKFWLQSSTLSDTVRCY